MSCAIDAGGEKSSLKNLKARFFQITSRWKLSSQISLTYGLIFFVTLIMMNIVTTAGVYYLFYHQAERAIEISVERTIQKAAALQTIDKSFFDTGAVMPSVIFRVTDEANRIVLDNNPNFWANEKMLRLARDNPPFWSNNDYTLIETTNSFFYYKDLPLKIGGEIFHFHFFKTITFEKNFIRKLLATLCVVDLLGLAAAIVAGIFLGRKVLEPLLKITKTAREISAGTINRRLAVKKSCAEVNELSAALNKMLDRLEESFIQQQRFIADASHELRTPITIVRGYADMLESYGAEDAELVEEATAEIKSAAKNMQYLVENLLFLARADQGAQPLNKIPVELNELLAITVDSFKNPRIIFTGDAPFEFSGDAEFLKKMFAAFIDNALIYSAENVAVNLKNLGAAAEVEIVDRGIGIAPENRDKIFDRFFKVDAARTNSDEDKISAGLGLSIAKWIADKHEIKIDVTSEIGGGAIFTLTISR